MKTIKKIISSLLAVTMVFSTMAFAVVANAEDLISINENTFPDRNFRDIILEVYDTNHDKFLSADERNKSIMTLAAYLEEVCGEDAVIDNLQGIEYFPNIVKLYCSGIGLNSLDVSHNTKLNLLSASGNNLKSVTLGTQTNLRSLDISCNELTSLDLSVCPNLTTLECFSNEITALNVSVLPNLQLLYCQQNALTRLDLSQNTNLYDLHCSNNKLWELDLSANTNLYDLTSVEIGNQWVSTSSYLQAGIVYANHVFSNTARLLSTSLDVVTETEDGTQTTLGYKNGNFFTDEAGMLKDKLVDENGVVYDGLTYVYNVGNENCENLTVNVAVTRTFYQVNYFLDETKQVRLANYNVLYGGSAAAPEVPDAPQCKRFVCWSDTATNVTEDKDIYIVWADDHVMHWSIDRNYVVRMYCENCVEKTITFNYLDAHNSKKGQSNYVEKGDMNKDGVINAKDFTMIIHQ